MRAIIADPLKRTWHLGMALLIPWWGRRGHNPMLVGFTTTYAISAYHHWYCSSNPTHGEVHSIQHYMIKFVTSWLASGQRFYPGTPVSITNKTDRHDVTEILLKVALNNLYPLIPRLGVWHIFTEWRYSRKG